MAKFLIGFGVGAKFEVNAGSRGKFFLGFGVGAKTGSGVGLGGGGDGGWQRQKIILLDQSSALLAEINQ